MIGILRIKLKPERESILSGNGGEFFHSFFFFLLKSISPSLAQALHKKSEIKPFSLFPAEIPEPEQGRINLKREKIYSFDVSLINEAVIKEFSESFASIPKSLEYKDKENSISLEGIEIKKGFTTYRNILRNAGSEKRITLEFLSPTSFRSKRKQKLFPEPSLVFGSLLKRWNMFSPVKIDEGIKTFFPHIIVTRYSLHTELVEFSSYRIIGFKGKITYQIPNKTERKALKQLNALAEFASYAGVGYKTTMGMGKTKRA